MRNKFYLLFVMMCIGIVSFAQNTNVQDPLSGKKFGIIGDSYVRNHREPVENTWHYKFAKKHHMQYFNYGINGNCVAMNRGRFGEAMYTRYKKVMADSLDYVVVVAGHNDATLLDSIGGIDKYKEKLNILCEGLIERYPKAKIFFFTSWDCKNFTGSNFEKVVDATKEVCGAHSIPVFDCARYSGVHAESDTFRKIYFQSPDDHAHLNAKGHDLFLPRAESFILQY